MRFALIGLVLSMVGLAPGADQQQAVGVQPQGPRAPGRQAPALVVEQTGRHHRQGTVVPGPVRRLQRPRQGEGQGRGHVLRMRRRRLLEGLGIGQDDRTGRGL